MSDIFNKDFIKKPSFIEIKPLGTSIDASIQIPSSKSLTNRALLISAISQGKSTLNNLLLSEDTLNCIRVLKELKININKVNNKADITGGLPNNEELYELNIGSAGTIARFLPGILCNSKATYKLFATEQLTKRPIQPLIDALKEIGGNIQYIDKANQFPIEIRGKQLQGGSVSLTGNISSQFISGLLIAAPLAQRPTQINLTSPIVQSGYVAMTIDLMENFGVSCSFDSDYRSFYIEPQSYKGTSYNIEPDLSTCSYFSALAAVTGGSIRLKNIPHQTKQPDFHFFHILETLGCKIEFIGKDIQVTGPKQLKGGMTFDMNSCSDTALTLAALAPFADGPIHLRNVEHIRKHESDRISVISDLLSSMSVKNQEYIDGLSIYPSQPKYATIDPHDDHRVAMALTITGLAGNGLRINNHMCVAKTCPDFFKLIEHITNS